MTYPYMMSIWRILIRGDKHWVLLTHDEWCHVGHPMSFTRLRKTRTTIYKHTFISSDDQLSMFHRPMHGDAGHPLSSMDIGECGQRILQKYWRHNKYLHIYTHKHWSTSDVGGRWGNIARVGICEGSLVAARPSHGASRTESRASWLGVRRSTSWFRCSCTAWQLRCT